MLTEKEKYIGIYSTGIYKLYGHSNHGKDALNIVLDWKPKSLLDVGCGYNEFVKQVRESGITSTGVDFACPGADIIAEAQNLPFSDKQFDVLTAFDVLEHLLPSDVDIVLKEFVRVSERFIFSISYSPSAYKWQGETLHPTVMPEKWWLERIEAAGGVNILKQRRYITGNWNIFNYENRGKT